MVKLKAIAIPFTPNSETKTKEDSSKIRRVSNDTTVFIFIFPTAERRFPYRFLKSMFIQKPANKITKSKLLSA